MKKIIIAQDIYRILKQKNNFLERADMLILAAATQDEALAIHRAEHADLIITELDMPGMDCDQFCSLIKADAELRTVPIIMVCVNTKEARERSLRCKANAVIPRPFKSEQLLARAKQLLNISWRETYRVLLSVSMEGNTSGQMFFCRSLDVSATGMLIETAQALKLGDRLSCNFFLPDATRIGATGEIVRLIQNTAGVDANRYGVQFTALSPETKKALETFIEAKTQKTQPDTETPQ